MLSLLRQGGIVQVFMGGIVVLIIAAFAVGYQTQGARDVECAVKVYDDCVTPKELTAAFRLSLNRDLSDEEVRRQRLRDRAQNGMVERQLLLREARRLGLTISDDDLDAELLSGLARFSLPADDYLRGARMTIMNVKNPKTGHLEWQMYKRFIANVARMNTKEFKEFQRSEIIAARLRDFVVGQARVSDAEAFAAYDYAKSKVTANVTRLTTDWFAKYAVDRSDAAVEAYVKAHAEDLHEKWEKAKGEWKAGCPLVSEILAETLTSEDGEEKKKHIDEAKKALSDGEPFEAVATRFGDGERAIAAGYVGCLTEAYGKGAKELIAAVEKLEPGKVSQVIETPRGFHVVKLHGTLAPGDEEKLGTLALARVAAAREAGEKAAEAFAKKLIAEGAKTDDYAALLQKLARETIVAPDLGEKKLEALRDAAMDAEGAPSSEVSAPFPRSGSPLFDAKEMGDGTGSAVFALEKVGQFLPEPVAIRSGLAVVSLAGKELVTKEDFEKDESREEFRESLRLTKGGDALTHYVERLRAAAEAHVKLNPKYGSDAQESAEQEGEPEQGG